MSTAQLWMLGAVAGLTIFLGLPVGRIRRPALRLRALLNAMAIGVLVFLFFDILSHANEIVEGALDAAKNDAGSWWRFLGFALLLTGRPGGGLVRPVVYEQHLEPSERSLSAATQTPPAATRRRFVSTPAHRL